eukprot:TRINITY_DN6820_c0_g1_i1.p2 TRINITY_DN6820_c0_g1~~TRINITY_DN6820_c0_g1_i1.p2  ORF type:complete len:101 (+),score=19.52 TRINITY_DN6820_c0_g1_i1:397-699(+)
MFHDWDWVTDRNRQQTTNFEDFIQEVEGNSDLKLVVVEVGAGLAVPTVRQTSEELAREHNGTLIRINPRDTEIPEDVVGVNIPLGGMKACLDIDQQMQMM